MIENNQQTDQAIQNRTETLFKTSDQLLHWFEQNPTAIKGDPEPVRSMLRHFRREAKQLNYAAHQPPAVAVFGASQAGKSYLVSGLATQPGQALIAHYQKEKLNFLQDMNPQGGNESTGLVSRFTTRNVSVPDADKPVPLRLLSAIDIIKILINTSLEDFKVKDHPLEDEQIQALFQSVASLKQQDRINSILDLDDLELLNEYLKQHYPDHYRMRQLKEFYWQQLKETVPYLSPMEAIPLFAPLWNGLPQFTELARTLFAVLEKLGRTEQVYCGTEALKPREKSILNVETLFTLGQVASKEEALDTVILLTEKGNSFQIDRSVVTALTAEITVPLGETAAWPFLRETDLLDFPGARSREMIHEPQAFLEAPEALGRLFLRGKVAYLFQRYEMEREITAMLLCIGDSIQNVSSLPSMIDEWIRNTIGATSEERARQKDNLFVVLTKFDREFEQKQGDSPESGARWTARINASLLDFFKTSNWVEDWKNHQPFQNLYWLRSTAIAFPAVMTYGDRAGVKCEVGIADYAKELVDTMRHAYLANREIQRYVASPEKAWDAALRVGDGGITYLAEALAESCNSRLKMEQIASQMEMLAANLARFVSPYYHSDNKEEAIQKATLEAQQVARSLMKCVSAQMFGPLLRALQVNREQMMEAWQNLAMQSVEQPVIIGRASDVDDLFNEMFPDAVSETLSEKQENETDQAKDRHEQYADGVLSKWNSAMDDFSRNTAINQRYGIAAEQLTALIAEISQLARRLNLRDRLAEKLRKNAALFTSNALKGETQVLLAETEIGNFVNWLGYFETPLQERPLTRGLKDEVVFMPRQVPEGLLVLPEHPVPYNERFVRDWISALVRRFEENAGASDLNGVDPAANAFLGRLISALRR